MANYAKQQQADILRHWPKSNYDSGDGGAVESLRPDVRKSWLVANKLPPGIGYYSVVTLPDRERISRAVAPTYKKLAKIDLRNKPADLVRPDHPRQHRGAGGLCRR